MIEEIIRNGALLLGTVAMGASETEGSSSNEYVDGYAYQFEASSFS